MRLHEKLKNSSLVLFIGVTLGNMFFPLQVRAFELLTEMSQRSYLLYNSCEEFSHPEALRGVETITSHIGECLALGGNTGVIGLTETAANNSNSLLDIGYGQLEDEAFEGLALAHMREMQCGISFCRALENGNGSEDISETLNQIKDSIKELKQLNSRLSQLTTSLALDPSLTPKVCPPTIQEIENLRAGVPIEQPGLTVCENIVRLRTAIELIQSQIPFYDLDGPIKEKVQSLTISGNSPLPNDDAIISQMRSSYGEMAEVLKTQSEGLERKLRDEGIEEFSRAEKRLLFSDPRLNQRLAETNPSTRGLVCRMNARYGAGADHMDVALGLGSFAIGGMLGLTARSIRFGALAATQARSVGLVSVMSARNLRLLAGVGVISADLATGISDIGNHCLKDFGLEIQVSGTDGSGQCLSAPSFEKRGKDRCILMASLAALGFAGGIGDLNFTRYRNVGPGHEYIDLGLSRDTYNNYRSLLLSAPSTERKDILLNFIAEQTRTHGDPSQAFEEFSRLAQGIDGIGSMDGFLQGLRGEELLTSLAEASGVSVERYIRNADEAEINNLLSMASTIESQNSNANISESLLGRIREFRPEIGPARLPSSQDITISGRTLRSPYSQHQAHEFLSARLGIVDDDELGEAFSEMMTAVNGMGLAPQERRQMLLGIALTSIGQPPGRALDKEDILELFAESEPELGSFFNLLSQIERGARNPREIPDRNVIANQLDQYFSLLDGSSLSQDEKVSLLYNYFKYGQTDSISNSPPLRFLRGILAERAENLPFLYGELAGLEEPLAGANGFYHRVMRGQLEDVIDPEEFEDFYDEFVPQLLRSGLSQNEADTVFIDTLTLSGVRGENLQSAVREIMEVNPTLYFSRVAANSQNTEDFQGLYHQYIEHGVRTRSEPGNLDQVRATFETSFGQRMSDLALDVHQVTRLNPASLNLPHLFLARHPQFGARSLVDLLHQRRESHEWMDGFLAEYLKFNKETFGLEGDQILADLAERLHDYEDWDITPTLNLGQIQQLLTRAEGALTQYTRVGRRFVPDAQSALRSNSDLLIDLESRAEVIEVFSDLRRNFNGTEEEFLNLWDEAVASLNLSESNLYRYNMRQRLPSRDPDRFIAGHSLDLAESSLSTTPYRSLITTRPNHGQIVELRPLEGGQGVTMQARLENGERVIWKPHNYAGLSNYKAEVLAYEVDQLLGLDLVPPTTTRVMNGEAGILQDFIPDHSASLRVRDDSLIGPQGDLYSDLRRSAPTYQRSVQDLDKQSFFDFLIGNRDRHSENFLLREDGRVVSIDHSCSFTSQCGVHGRDLEERAEEIIRFVRTEEGEGALARLERMIADPSFRQGMEENLGKTDSDKFFKRAQDLLRFGREHRSAVD